jgi:hypothetical protein
VLGSSAIEALAGAVAVVLAILGLAHVQPNYMLPVTGIALGLALLFKGGAVAARCAGGACGTGRCAMSAEFLGGVGGIVLGVLALLGITPVTLLSVAVIVYGAAVLLGAGACARMGATEAMAAEPASETMAAEAVAAALGAAVLVGLAVVILGILALVGFKPETLVFVAFLTLGASILIGGSALSGTVAAKMAR